MPTPSFSAAWLVTGSVPLEDRGDEAGEHRLFGRTEEPADRSAEEQQDHRVDHDLDGDAAVDDAGELGQRQQRVGAGLADHDGDQCEDADRRILQHAADDQEDQLDAAVDDAPQVRGERGQSLLPAVLQEGQGDAGHQGEEHHREDTPVGEGGEDVLRHDVGEHLGQRRRGLLLDLLGAVQGQPGAGRDQQRQADAGGHREGGGHQVVDEGLAADAPERRGRDGGDSGDEGEQDQRHDQHGQQSQEDVAERFDDRDRFAHRQSGDDAEHQCDGELPDQRDVQVPPPQRTAGRLLGGT